MLLRRIKKLIFDKGCYIVNLNKWYESNRKTIHEKNILPAEDLFEYFIQNQKLSKLHDVNSAPPSSLVSALSKQEIQQKIDPEESSSCNLI